LCKDHKSKKKSLYKSIFNSPKNPPKINSFYSGLKVWINNKKNKDESILKIHKNLLEPINHKSMIHNLLKKIFNSLLKTFLTYIIFKILVTSKIQKYLPKLKIFQILILKTPKYQGNNHNKLIYLRKKSKKYKI
jgi:hypothetical protein